MNLLKEVSEENRLLLLKDYFSNIGSCLTSVRNI